MHAVKSLCMVGLADLGAVMSRPPSQAPPSIITETFMSGLRTVSYQKDPHMPFMPKRKHRRVIESVNYSHSLYHALSFTLSLSFSLCASLLSFFLSTWLFLSAFCIAVDQSINWRPFPPITQHPGVLTGTSMHWLT